MTEIDAQGFGVTRSVDVLDQATTVSYPAETRAVDGRYAPERQETVEYCKARWR